MVYTVQLYVNDSVLSNISSNLIHVPLALRLRPKTLQQIHVKERLPVLISQHCQLIISDTSH